MAKLLLVEGAGHRGELEGYGLGPESRLFGQGMMAGRLSCLLPKLRVKETISMLHLVQ